MMNGLPPHATADPPRAHAAARAPGGGRPPGAAAPAPPPPSSSISFPTHGRGEEYEPWALEARWQAAWREAGAYATPGPEDPRTPAYVFAGCPFTSGDAHMGHVRSYTYADVCARFLRARGRAVLWSLGFDSFGLPAELEAERRGVPPREWVAQCCARMRGSFEALGYSCDWRRSFVSSEPAHYRWTQWLFLAMLERGLVYRREAQVAWCDSCRTALATLQAEDGRCWRCHGEVRLVRTPQWFLRVTAYVPECERGLAALTGWDRAALGSQRAVLGRVDGVELDAATLDGAGLTVFTPHPDALAQATFVALSPAHPDVDRWAADPRVARQLAGIRQVGLRREDRAAQDASLPVVATGALATVPGVAGTVPIVISPLVDARYGPTAVLGIPARDATDAAIAQRLPASTGTTWKAGRAASAPRPAVRYRARDFAISRQRAWGAPIPLVRCDACGTVPVPYEALPVRLPEDLRVDGGGAGGSPLASRPDFVRTRCPRCGEPAERETDTIDCHVDGAWMWMPICVPPEDRATAMFDHPEYARWLPAAQIVWGADAGAYVCDQRVVAKVLQDLGRLPPLPDREPFRRALMHQMVRHEGRKMSKHLDNALDPTELLHRVGADTARLAVLHAASPGRAFNWNEEPVRHCQVFLKRLYGYAAGRLREWSPRTDSGRRPRIDPSEKLRRRLAHWCAVAHTKVTADLERLETQRAAHNAMRLLARIQDFERRTRERRGGELEPADREAVVAALELLVQLLAPLTPHVAEELWSLAGHTTLVSAEPWPEPPERAATGGAPGTRGGPLREEAMRSHT